MPPFEATITKRVRRRQLKGRTVEQARWFVNHRDPETGQRKLPSFETKREAEAFRAELVAKVHAGVYVDPKGAPTIAEAVQHFLDNRSTEVKESTLYGHRVVAKTITGPLLESCSASFRGRGGCNHGRSLGSAAAGRCCTRTTESGFGCRRSRR